MAGEMQPLKHMGPVCSLKVLSNKLLLSGEGPALKIYDYLTGEKLFERIVFSRNKIHGIAVNDVVDLNDESSINITIWGGRSLSIFSLSDFKNMEMTLPHLGVDDWIFHCLFQDNNTLHILNSHNIVHTVSLGGNSPELVGSKNCDWKSILYSGTLHMDPETNKISVLAGTVMNGILIWDLESCQVKHNLTLHEGSIFNVISSPDGKYIISCSDDRSIKIWNTETGELLANGWGHGSRIWGLAVYDVVDDGFSVFSCSEDCTARVWTFKDDGSDELKQERIILGHTGRHVWSVAVDDVNKVGFTGGADGKILVTDLNEKERDGYWGYKWELKDIADECNVNFIKGELIKEYVDIGSGLLAVTSEGRIMILKHFKQWLPLFEDPRFERFCVLRGYQNESIVVLGNKFGNVIVMKFNYQCELILKEEFDVSDSFSRLGNLLVHEYNNKFFILLESPNPKDNLLYKELDPTTLTIKSSLGLIKPSEKIIISSVQFDSIRNYLLVGCRFATLLVFDISSDKQEPICVFKNIFKGDTISSLLPLSDPNDCLLYLTNKDGTYHIMKINNELQYEFLQSSKIQKGFLEGIIRLPNGDIVFYGFKSDSFFVWNETRQYEIMREICGGPHRRWCFKYWINESDGGLRYRFIYTRASEVQVVQMGQPYAVEILATGLHGREIRDVCVIDSKINNDEKIVITGAEDTTMKIGTLKNNGEFDLHWTYREHVAGLQSIHAVNSSYVISSSAREELFVWKINECDGKKCMTLHASLPPTEENPDLRIMDFDSIEVYDSDNDKKFPVGFLLVLVYSNSDIKVVYYDYMSKKFKVLIADSYMKCCIFHVKFLILDNKIFLMIGSTNGHITIYDVNNILSKSFRLIDGKLEKDTFEINESVSKLNKLIINQQMHQSSIKALEIIQNGKTSVNLITGGDDNALILSQIQIVENDEITVDIQSFIPSAAASTITTIKAVNPNSVLVGSVDQSMKLWDVSSDLQIIQEKYTTVADIGCSEVVNFGGDKSFLLVGGAGLSIWEV